MCSPEIVKISNVVTIVKINSNILNMLRETLLNMGNNIIWAGILMAPAQIKPHLSTEEMAVWVREAPTKETYKHRPAIWLTHIGPFHAHQVATYPHRLYGYG